MTGEELSWATVINGLIEAAAVKDSQVEDYLTPSPAVKEELIRVGSADRINPEITESSEDVRVDGGKAKCHLSKKTSGKGNQQSRKRTGGEHGLEF